jgi:tRNA pseudouridine38-40 synthase
MQRYFIYLAYDGTRYHGWQIQPNGDSVQQQLMNALQTLLRREMVEVTGAGRTDTGVHAKLMVAHFDHEEVLDVSLLTDKLNRLLPSDISVFKVEPVDADMHARFSAKARRYEYYVTTAKSPFMRQYRYKLHKAPDFQLMNQAAKLLLEVDDFTSFSKLHTDVKTNICHVTRAEWSQVDEVTWVFTIQADRFLRNMVRAIVGTLLEVGYGKLSLSDFQQVIQQKDRCSAGMSVPAQGLFLADIQY